MTALGAGTESMSVKRKKSPKRTRKLSKRRIFDLYFDLENEPLGVIETERDFRVRMAKLRALRRLLTPQEMGELDARLEFRAYDSYC